jgi:murein DD-endopeptidase
MKIAFFGLVVAISSAAHAGEQRVLGKFGQAVDNTYIYRTPNSKARAYCKVKQFQYLIVQEYTEKYTKVVMSNRTYGYVRNDKVVILPELVYETEKSQGPNTSGLSSRGDAANAGRAYIGKTKYVWGGNDINNGIDCSAFVKKLYGDIAGVNLPRTAAEQAKVGTRVTRYEDLQPGDRLYFWEKKRGMIGHTGMYLGNGYFIHSSRGHNGVATDFLSDKWRRILVAARR